MFQLSTRYIRADPPSGLCLILVNFSEADRKYPLNPLLAYVEDYSRLVKLFGHTLHYEIMYRSKKLDGWFDLTGQVTIIRDLFKKILNLNLEMQIFNQISFRK